MTLLRKIPETEFPMIFNVHAHAVERAIERLGKRRLKSIGNVESYLEQVARYGDTVDPGVFRRNGDGVCFSYTKTDRQIMVAVVVPIDEHDKLASTGYITTAMRYSA